MVDKLIFPFTNMKQRFHQKGGLRPDEALKHSDHALRDLKSYYERWVVEDISELEALTFQYKVTPTDQIYEKISEKIHFVKSEGATFGYVLMTDIATSLCKLITDNNQAERVSHENIYKHVKALRKIIDASIEGLESPAAQQILLSLN